MEAGDIRDGCKKPSLPGLRHDSFAEVWWVLLSNLAKDRQRWAGAVLPASRGVVTSSSSPRSVIGQMEEAGMTKNMATCYLTVDYRAPSRERMFLDGSWGARDVRGPYLMNPVGYLHKFDELLSMRYPSNILLTLTLSNRCPAPSVLVEVSTELSTVSQRIEKNKSSDFAFDSIYLDQKQPLKFSVHIPEIGRSCIPREFTDVLAIDELTLERFQ
jgi:hypothetical protein